MILRPIIHWLERRLRVHFVWWGIGGCGLWFCGPWPTGGDHEGALYLWRVILGPLEIRKTGALWDAPAEAVVTQEEEEVHVNE